MDLPAENTRGHVSTVHPLDVEAAAPPPQNRGTAKWVPRLVPAIVVANTVMFMYSMYVNNCPKYSGECVAGFLGRFSFQPIQDNPYYGPSSATLLKLGALDVEKVVNGHQGWRLITCIWLHGGVLHLVGNMFSLVVIGIRLEQEFGFVRIGLLYLISGYGGNVLSALFLRDSISVGASGAVFGLLGGMLSELIMNWSIYTDKVSALVTLVIVIISILALGISSHVNNFGHIGGFISGILLGFVFLIRPQFGWISQKYAPRGPLPTSSKPKFNVYQYVLWVLSLLLLVAGLAVGTRMVLHGVDANKYCSWCQYLSCFPTHKWSCTTARCLSVETADELTLTCSRNATRAYTLALPNPNATPVQLQRLCDLLCR